MMKKEHSQSRFPDRDWLKLPRYALSGLTIDRHFA
jgi:hypothetical protein